MNANGSSSFRSLSAVPFPLEIALRSEPRSGESGSGASSKPRSRTSRAACALSPCSRRTAPAASASCVARMASAVSSIAIDRDGVVSKAPSRRIRFHPLRKLRSIQDPDRPAEQTRLRLTTLRNSGPYVERCVSGRSDIPEWSAMPCKRGQVTGRADSYPVTAEEESDDAVGALPLVLTAFASSAPPDGDAPSPAL